jgi:RimJ/RimL family protein N-acetyltransferase
MPAREPRVSRPADAEGPVLRTPRLELRPVRYAEQAGALARVIEASDPPPPPGSPAPGRRAHAERTVGRSAGAFAAQGYGLWFMHRAGRDEPVGWCGLKDGENPARPELMYGLAVGARGEGLATEAVRALVAHAFSLPGVEAVWGAARPENEASLRVMARAGMTCEGTRTLDGQAYVVYRTDRRRGRGGPADPPARRTAD